MIDRYLDYLRDIRGLSPRTVRSYANDLGRFETFARDRGSDPAGADRTLVRAYISDLSRHRLAATSVNRMISSLRGYFRFLIRIGSRTTDPLSGTRGLREHQHLPGYLSEGEINRFFDLPGDDFLGTRDRLVFELLYSTGCRVAELVGMNLTDVSIAERTAKVRGKGNKERIVFLVDRAVEAVKTWIPIRENHVDRDDDDAGRALVLNNHGRRITVRGVFYLIRTYSDRLVPGKAVGPHTFRHSFATHLLNRGANIRMVQEMLGHSNLSTTQVYTHTGIERLASVYRKAHPHATLEHRVGNCSRPTDPDRGRGPTKGEQCDNV